MSDLERELTSGSAPWRVIDYRTKDFWVFDYNGELVFAPTHKKAENIYACFQAAYKFGTDGVLSERWNGFSIRQDCGEASGQTIDYPHIRMIPRYQVGYA